MKAKTRNRGKPPKKRKRALNPVKSYKRLKATRFAEGLMARYKREHLVKREAQTLNELAETIRDPEPSMRANGILPVTEMAKKSYRQKLVPRFFASEIRLTYYRFLLEGKALEGKPVLLKKQIEESKTALEKARQLLKKKQENVV